jgi:hypothetical protein
MKKTDIQIKEIPAIDIDINLLKLIRCPKVKHQKKMELLTANTNGIDALAGPKFPKTYTIGRKAQKKIIHNNIELKIIAFLRLNFGKVILSL